MSQEPGKDQCGVTRFMYVLIGLKFGCALLLIAAALYMLSKLFTG
jgi:hypothetical protein